MAAEGLGLGSVTVSGAVVEVAGNFATAVADLRNSTGERLNFILIGQVKDLAGVVVVPLTYVPVSLFPGQSSRVSLPLGVLSEGSYVAELFVWTSLETAIPLSGVTTISFTVPAVVPPVAPPPVVSEVPVERDVETEVLLRPVRSRFAEGESVVVRGLLVRRDVRSGISGMVVDVSVDGFPVTSVQTDFAGGFTVDLGALVPGMHSVSARFLGAPLPESPVAILPAV